MEYTSAQANKLLKRLQEERGDLLNMESMSRTFTAATVENIEDARPDYDYASVQQRLAKLEEKIRTVKHCVNTFNVTHTVEGFDMTVDQMLVYIPQLRERKEKLSVMAATLAKTRLSGGSRSNIIEYSYANYDVKRAEEDYAAVSELLSRAQLALDSLNTTATMEIDL